MRGGLLVLYIVCLIGIGRAALIPCNTYPNTTPPPTDGCYTRPAKHVLLCHRTGGPASPLIAISVPNGTDVEHHITCHNDFYAGSWVGGVHYGCNCEILPPLPSPSTPPTTPSGFESSPSMSPISTVSSSNAQVPSIQMVPSSSEQAPTPHEWHTSSEAPNTNGVPSMVEPSPSIGAPTNSSGFPSSSSSSSPSSAEIPVDAPVPFLVPAIANPSPHENPTPSEYPIQTPSSDAIPSPWTDSIPSPSGNSCNDTNETPDCRVVVCHFTHGRPKPTPKNVSCDTIDEHLEHGDFFPNTVRDGIHYDANCTKVGPCMGNNDNNNTNDTPSAPPIPQPSPSPEQASPPSSTTPVPCPPNTTVIPKCDCNTAFDLSCIPLDCGTVCAHGGACNPDIHLCECYIANDTTTTTPVPSSAPVPSIDPSCGDNIVNGDEECDGGLHCSSDCKLPRPNIPCIYLVCQPVSPYATTPDVFTWLSEYCICLDGPQPCANNSIPSPTLSPPDSIEDDDKCTNYDTHVVCPAGLYTTHHTGYWIAIIGSFIFLSVTLSYVGSFL